MKKIIFFSIYFLVYYSLFSQESPQETDSFLKIPFNHFDYNDLEGQIADSLHTGIKPLHYFEINSGLISDKYQSLKKDKTTWLGCKLFNEHFFDIPGEDYHIFIDPVIDWRLGKDNLNTNTNPFQNTRGIRVEGILGKQFSFSSTIAENWARLPVFADRYVWSKRPTVVPGFGVNKSYDHDHVDYPYAEGYFAYKPSKFFFFELGHGQHFIGDGYRSLFLSDNAGVYPYFKVEASFWKVKYTTIWTAFQDIRYEVTENGVYQKKYSATHYIDWNALPKLNIGFFETVIWYNENGRDFDVNFLNPLIFFKTAELEAGSGGSNTMLGLSGKYKLPENINVYGQFILDEMTIDKFFNESGYWANKFGYQIGVKYYDAFHIDNLFLRIEYNTVRPYTYAHNTITANYGHNYQSLAHPWGANFKETVFEAQYRHQRWYVYTTISTGKKGFDYPGDETAYGGNIYNYILPEDRFNEVYTLQGNVGEIFFSQNEAGYILNPVSHLKIFGGFIYRKTSIEVETPTVKNETSKYVYFGIKTHLWNDHFDNF